MCCTGSAIRHELLGLGLGLVLEDIGEQIDAGTMREYFIGTVLVSPTDQKNHYEVIDGQQRLTTFFLLLCTLGRKTDAHRPPLIPVLRQ